MKAWHGDVILRIASLFRALRADDCVCERSQTHNVLRRTRDVLFHICIIFLSKEHPFGSFELYNGRIDAGRDALFVSAS